MEKSENRSNTIRLPEDFGYLLHSRYLRLRDAVFCQCQHALALVSLDGELLLSFALEKQAELIAIREESTSWQALLKCGNGLQLVAFSDDRGTCIDLQDAAPDALSAKFSPCGELIAIGHGGETSVSVYRADTGQLVWRRSLEWDADECLLGWPPGVTVSGWSTDAKYLVTSATLVTNTSIVWCVTDGRAITTISSA